MSDAELGRQVALVTGAGSGLGRATAVAFAAQGARVLVADRDDVGGRETVDLVAGRRWRGAVRRDRRDRSGRGRGDGRRARSTTFGRLDFAVNNAGTTGKGGMTADYDIDDWHRTMALNLDSVFFCLRAEIPVMLRRGGGAIVNVASGAGLVGFAGLPAYVASKHGVVGLTHASARSSTRRRGSASTASARAAPARRCSRASWAATRRSRR